MAQGFKGKIAKKQSRKASGGAKRKNMGRTKKGGGNGKLSQRKRFGAGGSGTAGREKHMALHKFKKNRSAQVRTTIEGEMATTVLRRGENLTLLKGLAQSQGRDILPELKRRPSKKNPYRKPAARPPKALHPLDPKAMKMAVD
jgi:hypothetical protein